MSDSARGVFDAALRSALAIAAGVAISRTITLIWMG